MSLNVCFVPSTPVHVDKFRVLMEALRAQGSGVRALCLDPVQLPLHWTRRRLEASSFPFDLLNCDNYSAPRHWLLGVRGLRTLQKSVRTFLEARPIDVLVLGTDAGLPARTLVRVARSLGISTVLLADGLAPPRNPAFHAGAWLSAKVFVAGFVGRRLGVYGTRGASGVDLILLLNKSGYRELVQHGVPPERIRVVGSPEYDALAAELRCGLGRFEPGVLRRRLALPPDGPVVTFIQQPAAGTRQDLEGIIATMQPAVRACAGSLLVKFHPRSDDDLAAWNMWAEKRWGADAGVFFVRTECTSVEALCVCSACVTICSTVALEAFILGKPLVLIQYLNVKYALHYGQVYEAAIDVESPAQLEAAITKVLTDVEVCRRLRCGATAALEDEFLGLDGRSTERIVESIQQLISRRTAPSSAPG